MKIRTLYLAALAAVASLAMSGCFFDTIVGPSTNVYQNQGQSGGSPSASPSPSALCPPVTGVNDSIVGGQGVVPVGTVVRLDASPVFAFALAEDEAKRCAGLATVTWSDPGGPCVKSSTATQYDVTLTRDSPGSCTSAPTVNNITGADITVAFQ